MVLPDGLPGPSIIMCFLSLILHNKMTYSSVTNCLRTLAGRVKTGEGVCWRLCGHVADLVSQSLMMVLMVVNWSTCIC